MNESDSQIAKSSHDLRSRASAQARAILSKRDIANVMQAILNAPMSSVEIKQTPRSGLDGSEVGDEVDNLLGGFASLMNGHRASQTGYLTDEWPIGSQVSIETTADLDQTDLGSSAMTVNGAVTLKRSNDSLRIVEIERQVLVQRGLIALDGQNGRPRTNSGNSHKLSMSMERISRVDARMEW